MGKEAAELRARLRDLAETYAGASGVGFYRSFGRVVLFQSLPGRHGNFIDASYAAIPTK